MKKVVKVSDEVKMNIEYFKERFPDIKDIYVNEDKKTTVLILHSGVKAKVSLQKGDIYNNELGILWSYVKAKETESKYIHEESIRIQRMTMGEHRAMLKRRQAEQEAIARDKAKRMMGMTDESNSDDMLNQMLDILGIEDVTSIFGR